MQPVYVVDHFAGSRYRFGQSGRLPHAYAVRFEPLSSRKALAGVCQAIPIAGHF
jgi:hypothetical protein